MRPIQIPETTPTRYLSFKHALNLRYPDEWTGDWHFLPMFFEYEDSKPRTTIFAGEGGYVDTTPSLGSRGVRDMADIVESQGIRPNIGPVYVANHYRAITDIVMLDLEDGRMPMMACVSEINAWLDTEEQVNELVNNYLFPLRSQLEGDGREVYNHWISTVRFE